MQAEDVVFLCLGGVFAWLWFDELFAFGRAIGFWITRKLMGD